MLSVWKLFGFSFDRCLLICKNPFSSPSEVIEYLRAGEHVCTGYQTWCVPGHIAQCSWVNCLLCQWACTYIYICWTAGWIFSGIVRERIIIWFVVLVNVFFCMWLPISLIVLSWGKNCRYSLSQIIMIVKANNTFKTNCAVFLYKF